MNPKGAARTVKAQMRAGEQTPNQSRHLLTCLVLAFWLLFAAGLVVHLMAPNLEKKEKAFVIPLTLGAGAGALRPDLIVAKERRMQGISAVLTVSGALGLFFFTVRHSFGRTRPRQEPTGTSTWVSAILRNNEVTNQTQPKKRNGNE